MSPFLHPDNLTFLFFSSEGHTGMEILIYLLVKENIQTHLGILLKIWVIQ